MLHLTEIWDILKSSMPRGQWVPLEEIYQLVKRCGSLDAEDFEPQSPTSNIPKWKRNVRNVLQYRKKTQEIQWDKDATRYLLL